MFSGFTPSHRGGSGPPLVCLHGFMDTWRTWELVLPTLERHHDVLAVTLPGHAGGSPLDASASSDALVDAVEDALDEAGLELPHLAGNSLGGYIALRLASRGRAASVITFAPAGGWATRDRSDRELLRRQHELYAQMRAAAPHADAYLATAVGRRRVTQHLTVSYEHIPRDILAHLMLGVASCRAATALIDMALSEGWSLDAARITCPTRVVWGTADDLLPWPRAAARYRERWLPHADWVLLDGVGHCPQLDVPLETAQLIAGLTDRH